MDAKVRDVIEQILHVVDNMGTMRSELCEESIKELDRGLASLREKISATPALEDKIALMKDQRDMEHVRAERKRHLFMLIDDGELYAHEPLPRDDLLALVAPLRTLLAEHGCTAADSLKAGPQQ